MSHINKVIISGELKDKPEIKNIGDSNKVANFTIITKETYKDKTSTEYTKCVAWGKLAESVSNLNKGEIIALIGRKQTDSYDKDGVKQYVTKYVASRIETKNAISFAEEAADEIASDLPF